MVFAFLLGGFVKRGISMVILQVLRVFTIIGLGTVMAASWALTIKIDTGKPYFVFDAASLIFMSGIAFFLAVSELPIGKRFFETHWPAFSLKHGLGWLGLALLMIGCNILGKLNNSKTQPGDIGLPWWRLVLASGILNLVFGFLNIVATFALHDWLGGQNVRVIRTIGAAKVDSTKEGSLPYSRPGSPYSFEKNNKSVGGKILGFALDRVRRKAGSSKEAPRPHISHPVSAHKYPEADAPSDYDDPEAQTSPIQPGITKPDNAFHPAFWKDQAPRPPSSLYSAAHRSRF